MPQKRKAEEPCPQTERDRCLEIRDQCLIDLRNYLSSNSKVPMHTAESDVKTAKSDLEECGFIFLPNCTTPEFAERYIKQHLTEMIDMFPCAFFKTDREEIVNRMNFKRLQDRRSIHKGMSCLNFGALFQHPAPKEDQPQMEIPVEGGSEKVYMCQLPSHRVNIQMLAEIPEVAKFMIRLIGGSLEPGGRVPVCAPDSAKIIQVPQPLFTDPHCDNMPSIDRHQAVWNCDDNIKLTFVPLSHTVEFEKLVNRVIASQNKLTGKNYKYFIGRSKKEGYTAIPNIIPLVDLLRKFAVAPPRNSIAIWHRRTIHLEIPCLMGPDNIGRYSFQDTKNQRRIRAYIGLHFNDSLPVEARIKLGLISHRHGLVPQMFFGDNKGLKIEPHIVSKRSSQWLARRNVELGEKVRLQQYCDESYTVDDLVREVPDKLTRILLTGVNF